jgi:hypothetical protein
MSELPMLTHVEFRSDKFPAYEGEEEQINPDLWGKRLTEFLCDKLLTEGFKTEEPLAEDWGWRIDVVNEGFSLWIGCGHYQEYPDGYLCFIDASVHTPQLRHERNFYFLPFLDLPRSLNSKSETRLGCSSCSSWCNSSTKVLAFLRAFLPAAVIL